LTEEEKVLQLVKDDIDSLLHRLNNHFEDYMRVFTQKRTRDHFQDVFYSRFRDVNISDLLKLDGELLGFISSFYFHTEELYWYIKVTEDMPSMVENKIRVDLVKINSIVAEINELILSGDSNIGSQNTENKSDDLDLPPPFEDDITKQ